MENFDDASKHREIIEKEQVNTVLLVQSSMPLYFSVFIGPYIFIFLVLYHFIVNFLIFAQLRQLFSFYSSTISLFCIWYIVTLCSDLLFAILILNWQKYFLFLLLFMHGTKRKAKEYVITSQRCFYLFARFTAYVILFYSQVQANYCHYCY